ncbi:hypothetical protein EFK50_03605 [Nocardioides marmoriginsengisoli]|uniref:Cholesterol esterase n=1 Tax=Nocardioides marmoriginsengisoli TaxID=661483 RepID=A0A3N0CQ97_9ACTN|nr:DUF6230 family protein [Nocardioides marmoriginsengisoli]RNL65073.1 hypothetical protein EFK50_03605 [Nocardioides marmoriginsengisoli]
MQHLDASPTRRGARLRQRLRDLAGRSRSSWRAHVDAMVTTSDSSRNGTRKRTALMAATGLGALGALFGLVSANVLAVNFTTGDSAYSIYSDEVIGANAAGFINAQQKNNGSVGVAQIGFKTAELNGMCLIAKQTLPVIGDVSLLISAGEKVDGTVTSTAANKINASYLFLAADTLTGAGKNISGLTLGQSASTVTMGGTPLPAGQTGTPGAFGLQAVQLDLLNLNANTYGVALEGSINLPNLSITVKPGTLTKANCP